MQCTVPRPQISFSECGYFIYYSNAKTQKHLNK